MRELKASTYAPFVGAAEGCHLSFERIAGFKPGDERMKKMSIDIWWADIGIGPDGGPGGGPGGGAGGGPGGGPGGGKVPVRLELNTPWGVGFAHLARARRADGTLVFGEAGK